ncbi:hypothetical protein ONE63_004625 [Megalurothrips usitatus]|uniref:Cytochrome P450 4C1-like n=1 Tax=Megalurothrips usitatus TaxID=439358 RepID=A0AAV7X109_9NEOP|nr:hypothetical protein ONE63_004625 [Megalurothrips usitatus]
MGAVSAVLALSAAACALAVAALALARYVRWRLFWHRALSPFPGPDLALPVIGTLLHILGPMDTIFERGLRLLHGGDGDGSTFKFWLGERPWLHLTRPEDLEGLLNSGKQTHKPEVVYGPVSGFFGRGLITLNGEAWRRHRRVLTPAFHFAVLERYSGIFTRRAALFADKLAEAEAGGHSFDFMPHIGAFVTDTVMETAFGLQGGDERDPRDREDFIKATDTAFKIIADRVMKPWLMVDAMFRWSPLGAKQAEADRVINLYAQRVIRLKQKQIAGKTAGRGVLRGSSGSSGQGVLSDDEILNEVRTLIAVQQTSASTLSFAVVCLALNADVQRRARAEVLAVDAEPGLAPLDRLNRLKYLERVLKETLRMYPITAIFSRTLGEDLHLPAASTKQGLGVTVFAYQTHRDPRHWPDPERFDPDRFLPERSAGRHPYAYIPFSAGPRNCIGQRYAMLQMKAVLAALLRAAELTPGEGCARQDALPLNMNTFLYIRGGFNVRLRGLSS